jgi:hypothetical protein
MICPTGKAEYFSQEGWTEGVKKRASEMPSVYLTLRACCFARRIET